MNSDVKKWLEQDGVKFLKEIGLKRDQTILDFGSGEGHYTIPAAKVVGREGKVYALDKDSSALNKLKKRIGQHNIKNVELINENLKIPLIDASIDIVLCYDVIHYGNEKERKAIYNEVYRVLNKDGLFSVYPKHHKKDSPLMELADIDLEKVVEEIEKAGFVLKDKFLKSLLHDEYYNKGYVLNFRRC